MNGKTMLLLGLAVLGGMILGAVGMQYVGSWESVAQAIGALRQPGTPPPATTRAAVSQPTDQAEHDAHEGHAHAEDTPAQGAAPHAHDHDEPSPAAPRGAAASKADTQRTPPPPVAAKGARPPKADAHGHGEEAHGHEDEKMVRLPAAKVRQLGITVEVARADSLRTSLTLPGAIALNADRQVHIVSRIPGIVQEIRKQLGDAVRAGEVMAVIDSRELADTKAAYLAARERVSLAETTFTREKDLWEKKISPAEDYLKAKQALAEVRIELQVAAQKLRALGFSEASVQQLAGRANASLTRYEVVAPFAGTVIERHIAVGEVLKDDTEAFLVADLSTVWVDLNLAAKDLALVRKGQRVVVAADTTVRAEGTVSYISPRVSDETRTVLTRVVLPNPDGRWRPGLFVTAILTASETPVAVLIPKTALQTIEGQPNVFVQTPDGFVPRPVTLGRVNETHVELTAGLAAGERYAATETIVLKADLGKGTGSHSH